MHRLFAAPLLVVITALVAAGCGAASSPSPSPATVTSPDAAAEAVKHAYPEFADLEPQDPDLIGGCCWYEATEVDGAYRVEMRVGWGDCPAGCINEHRWTFAVSPDGTVEKVSESGDPIPPGEFPPQG